MRKVSCIAQRGDREPGVSFDALEPVHSPSQTLDCGAEVVAGAIDQLLRQALGELRANGNATMVIASERTVVDMTGSPGVIGRR
jgi:hypothetical protein